MQLHRLLFILLSALAISHVAADDAPDPCLAEDYAEANCARSRALAAHKIRQSKSLTRWHARGVVSLVRADGTCCAQGGYRLPGHGDICKVVGPKVKAKKEL